VPFVQYEVTLLGPKWGNCPYLLWNVFVEEDVPQRQCNMDKFFRNARLRDVNALLCQGQKCVEKFLGKQT
jgi:hypothetical protein